MGIVKEMVNANGGRVMIADDCYRQAGADELERRRVAISRAILEIDRKYQLMDNEERGREQ